LPVPAWRARRSLSRRHPILRCFWPPALCSFRTSWPLSSPALRASSQTDDSNRPALLP
jgi:hypothetical protein